MNSVNPQSATSITFTKFKIIWSLFVIFILVFSSKKANSQCFENGVEFLSQSEINNFPVYYPNCTKILGPAIIKAEYDYIHNLDSLIYITEFSDDLQIEQADFADFNGLNNLKKIGGNLIIKSNSHIFNLYGLHNLDTIMGDLILHNTNINTLEHFTSLKYIGGKIDLSYNYDLLELQDLPSLDIENLHDIIIHHNINLSDCSCNWICNYIDSPNGELDIYENASGCNSLIEVFNNCNVEMSCLPFGNYRFSSQNEVDQFTDYYTDCIDLGGSLIITGNVNDLNALQQIESIENALRIENTNELTSLDGLNQLQSVSQIAISDNASLYNINALNNIYSLSEDLIVHSNDTLYDLSGLENLESIDGNLEITSNLYTTNINALSGLSEVGGDLSIWYNYPISSFSGLENLSVFNGDLKVIGNSMLTDLSGLNNISNTKNLEIKSNHQLSSLNGLDQIEIIDGDFKLEDNPNLSEIDALSSLAKINNKLVISSNDIIESIEPLSNVNSYIKSIRITSNYELTTLEGLENIEIDSIAYIDLINNTNLSMCSIESFCDYFYNSLGGSYFRDNSFGCNSEEEIIDNCEGVDIIEYEQEETLIFPNPFSNYLNIHIKEELYSPIEFYIYNSTGQCVKTNTYHDKKDGIIYINTTELTSGFYMVVLKSQNLSKSYYSVKI